MAKRSNIWTDEGSRYGTYDGPRGNPSAWAGTFSGVWENSPTVKALESLECYRILGVQPNASKSELKARFRSLVKLHHPDHGGDRTTYEQVVDAYRRITNPSSSSIVNAPNFTPSSTQTARPESPVDLTGEPLVVPQLLTEIDESEVDRYINDANFCAQEKKDGKHLTLQIPWTSNQLFVRNKKGDISTCSPDFEAALRAPNLPLLIDGEQVNGIFYTWDILELNGTNLRTSSYRTRYSEIKSIACEFGPNIKLVDIAITTEEKRALFNSLKAQGKEGIVFKRLDAPFSPGKGEDQVKFKFYSEASVIVVAGRPNKASIGMELIDNNGTREFVGYCSCALHPLPPVNSIAEVRYLYAYRGGCLYQTSFKELRDDVDISECRTSQLKYKYEEL
jgi:hypothetical protein